MASILGSSARHVNIDYVEDVVEDVYGDRLECDGRVIGTNSDDELIRPLLGAGDPEGRACGMCSYFWTNYPSYKLTMCTTTCGKNSYALHRTRTSSIEVVSPGAAHQR